MKAKHKTLLRLRLRHAVADIYHNATPRYPVAKNDFESELFQQWFEDYALDSIYFFKMDIQAYKNNPCEFCLNRDNCYLLLSKYDTNFYCYGRGGRTFAPDFLWHETGSGVDIQLDGTKVYNMSDLTELILAVESFNRFVNAWNYDIPESFEQFKILNDITDDVIYRYDADDAIYCQYKF